MLKTNHYNLLLSFNILARKTSKLFLFYFIMMQIVCEVSVKWTDGVSATIADDSVWLVQFRRYGAAPVKSVVVASVVVVVVAVGGWHVAMLSTFPSSLKQSFLQRTEYGLSVQYCSRVVSVHSVPLSQPLSQVPAFEQNLSPFFSFFTISLQTLPSPEALQGWNFFQESHSSSLVRSCPRLLSEHL